MSSLSGAPLFDASFFGAALFGASFFGASAFGRGVRPLLPVLEEDDEGDVVRHQKGGNPECGDPVRRSHMGCRAIDRGECYGGDQIHSAPDVKTHTRSRAARALRATAAIAATASKAATKSPKAAG